MKRVQSTLKTTEAKERKMGLGPRYRVFLPTTGWAYFSDLFRANEYARVYTVEAWDFAVGWVAFN